MAAYVFRSHRRRLQVDVTEVDSAIDRQTWRTLRVPIASRVALECGFFANLLKVAPASADQVVDVTVANPWTSLVLAIQSISAPGTNIVSKSTSSFAALTYTAWNADTGQHCSLALSDAETNVAPDIYRMTLRAVNGDSAQSFLVGSGDFEIYQADGTGSSAAAPVNPGAPFSLTITGYTGGGDTNLDGYITVGLGVGFVLQFIHPTEGYRVFQLQAGTTAENSPFVIRPDDYNASTNAKVWIACN